MGMFNRRASAEVAGLRAEVDSLQSRLVADVSTLDPGDSALCRQAMSDASERNNAAGGLLARASTAAEMRVAVRIVVEGLQATRVVREHQGLSLGPELPDVTSAATVNQPTPVTVNMEKMTAQPGYRPEQPHYFPGGTVSGTPVPGGYYRTPFWKKAMMIGGAVAGGEMLGGMLGGGSGGDDDNWGGGGGGDWGGGDDGGW